MINLNEITKMLNFIYNENPRFVISLGCPNITADLASAFTTVLSIPCLAILPVSISGNLLVPRELTDKDRELLNTLNMENTALYSVQYGFRPPDYYGSDPAPNRADFGIAEDAEVFVIVGSRLNEEVTDEFCDILEQVIQQRPNTVFMFIGSFPEYQQRMEEFPLLYRHSVVLGYRRDVRELLQLCDYYINPPREGGGTSSVCALTHGIPVFSQPWGDVVKQACGEGYYIPWYTANDILNYLHAKDSGDRISAFNPTILKERAAAIADRDKQVREFCDIAETAIERNWGTSG